MTYPTGAVVSTDELPARYNEAPLRPCHCPSFPPSRPRGPLLQRQPQLRSAAPQAKTHGRASHRRPAASPPPGDRPSHRRGRSDSFRRLPGHDPAQTAPGPCAAWGERRRGSESATRRRGGLDEGLTGFARSGGRCSRPGGGTFDRRRCRPGVWMLRMLFPI